MERKLKLTKRVLHKEATPYVFDKPFQLQKRHGSRHFGRAIPESEETNAEKNGAERCT